MGDDRNPIDDAIEHVEMAGDPPETVNATAQIPLLRQAHAWRETDVATVDAQPGPRPTLLVWNNEARAWRGIILPDGSRWALTCIGRSDGIIVPAGPLS